MRKRPNTSMSNTLQSIMKYNDERRVLVSLNASDNALSIVDHPKDVIQRLFQRRPSRSLEFSAIRSLRMSGAELSIGVADGEVVKLECVSLADGEAWCVPFCVCAVCTPLVGDMSCRHAIVSACEPKLRYQPWNTANAGIRACACGADRQIRHRLACGIRATPLVARQRPSAQS